MLKNFSRRLRRRKKRMAQTIEIAMTILRYVKHAKEDSWDFYFMVTRFYKWKMVESIKFSWNFWSRFLKSVVFNYRFGLNRKRQWKRFSKTFTNYLNISLLLLNHLLKKFPSFKIYLQWQTDSFPDDPLDPATLIYIIYSPFLDNPDKIARG